MEDFPMAKEARILYVGPEKMRVSLSERRNVALMFDLPGDFLGFAEGLSLGLELTPDEARHLAASLQNRAASAEAE
jgi:cell division septal protein FtsQ